MGDTFWAFYKYHAIRNPADGIRNFDWLNLDIEPDKVRYVTWNLQKFYEPWYIKEPGVYGYAAWQGVWLGIKVIWIRETSYSEIKFGFRVEPGDAHGNLDPNGSRAIDGGSFASKVILNREL